MYQSNFYVLNRVRKTTVLAVLAQLNPTRIHMTELRFVLILVVKPFDSVMRSAAFVHHRALFTFSVFAELGGIQVIRAASVFDGVIEEAGLVVVGHRELQTFESFEVFQH